MPGLVDRHAVTLAIAADLKRGAQSFDYKVAVKDHVEDMRYERGGNETLNVPAGTFDTVLMRRVGEPGTDRKRVARSWFSEKLDWMPVQIEQTENPHPVGNTTGGSWHGVVLAQSAHQDAAYSFLSLMAIKPVSMWAVEHGWTGINPGFSYQMLPPDGQARLADYVKAGWNPADVKDYLKAFDATFNAPTMLNYLRIRGTAEYWSVLDSQLAAALGHRKTPQQALDDVAADWERITDRLGWPAAARRLP